MSRSCDAAESGDLALAVLDVLAVALDLERN
jgi:hypothetical protein